MTRPAFGLQRGLARRLHSRPVSSELPVLVIDKPLGVQSVLQNIQANVGVHRLFLILSCGPTAENGSRVSALVNRKDGGDPTHRRSGMTRRGTGRPPPPTGINAVPDGRSLLYWEPPTAIRQEGYIGTTSNQGHVGRRRADHEPKHVATGFQPNAAIEGERGTNNTNGPALADQLSCMKTLG